MLAPHAWNRVQNSPAGFAVPMLCLHYGTGCTAVQLPYALSTCVSQGSKQSCRFFASCHALSTCMAQGLPQSRKFCQLSRSLYMHGTVFITVLQALPVAMLPLRAWYKVYSSLPGFASCHPLSPHALYWFTTVLPVLPVAMLFLHACHRVQNSPAGFASCLAISTCMSQGSKPSCGVLPVAMPSPHAWHRVYNSSAGFASCHALSTVTVQGSETPCSER